MSSTDCSGYDDKHILVLGLGLSGRSAVRFLLRRGALVVGADRNYEALKADKEIVQLLHDGMQLIHDDQPCKLSEFDLVVISPGVSPSHPYLLQALDLGIEVIGEVELACRAIKQKCLAVTGTNGKTTVALLVAHVLNQSGIAARALGNVGVSLISAVDEINGDNQEIFVIELSSFQLDTLQSKFIDAGVILNITPDHLDRYITMEAYAKSKIHLFDCLKPSGKLFVEEKCYTGFSNLFGHCQFFSYGYHKECFLYTDTRRIYVKDEGSFALPSIIQGKSSHDVENLMAAYALCREVGITAEQFLSALQSFKKPSHRIEFVRTINGVHYIDDSKGTNLDAVVRAADTIDGKIILIAGGVDKGASYTIWLDSLAPKLKSICAIGKAAEKIKSELGQHIHVELFATLDDAVAYSAKVSQAGDTVLLSPGCASYDMFKDYAHRGNEFQRLVRAL